MNRDNIKLLIGTFIAASITWFINHNMGYGAIVANGLVGVIAASFLSPKFAGAFYVASFVGMSGTSVMPSMLSAGVAGLFAGVVIICSQEVYGGIGGKGGTIAAISTQLMRGILHFFI